MENGCRKNLKYWCFKWTQTYHLFYLEKVDYHYSSFFKRAVLCVKSPEGPHSTGSLLLTKLYFAVRWGVAGEPFKDGSLKAVGWLIACLPLGFFPVFHHG